METGFEWVPFYEELARVVAKYRHNQDKLINALTTARVDNGLTDENPKGTKIPLSEIDPFTFFSLLNKYQGEKRSARLSSIKVSFSLSSMVPTAYHGVPTAQATNAWFFPYKYNRNAGEIEVLWNFFEECLSGDIRDITLKQALDIPYVAQTKLTQAMFWIAPQKYLPLDIQTKPYLTKHGINPEFSTVAEYLSICDAAKNKLRKPTYVISFEAWEENQKATLLGKTANSGVKQPVSTNQVGIVQAKHPLNVILYGPPGTGKTYTTKQLAVEICEGSAPKDRDAVLDRYNTLCQQNRIEFVTFHQSFSYEDFVEGLRPVIDDTDKGDTQYECRPGVFKRTCTAAEAAMYPSDKAKEGVQLGDRRLFKMSLGNTLLPDEAYLYSECMKNGYILLGYGEGMDYTGCKTAADIANKLKTVNPTIKSNDYNITSVYYLISEIKVGDLILVSDGNSKYRAIGEVTGEYEYLDRQGKDTFCQKRAVKWIRQYEESQPIDLIFGKRLSQMTVYLMDQSSIKHLALEAILAPQVAKVEPDNYVLVIDEINRANISKVLGELISLLEPDKRLGAKEELRVRLPYSQKEFGVPKNLYVIGTMNTADRSIALLDTALRRRFEFREMCPDYSVLDGAGGGLIPDGVGGQINLRYLLMAINDRLEFLLGRDQRIGHAYLTNILTLDELNRTFIQQIIPLLQEYFYEDWAGIAKILAVPKEVTPFISKHYVEAIKLFGLGSDDESRDRYSISSKLTGDMYRSLYHKRDEDFANRLPTS